MLLQGVWAFACGRCSGQQRLDTESLVALKASVAQECCRYAGILRLGLAILLLQHFPLQGIPRRFSTLSSVLTGSEK